MAAREPTLRVSTRHAYAELTLWTLVVAAVTGDAVTTLIALWAGAPETNPLLAPLAHISPSVILVIKAAQLLVMLIVWRVTHPSGRLWVLGAGGLIQSGIVALNLATIAAAA